jgi:glutamine synthetase
MVYTVGPQADPGGIVREMTEHLAQLGLEVLAAGHEFMNSQYEINLRHTDALRDADRAFRLKAAVKDIAAQHGLVATFMGKPFNDQGGSGTHLHVSLDRDERNAFDARGDEHGVSAELRAFTAGVLPTPRR